MTLAELAERYSVQLEELFGWLRERINFEIDGSTQLSDIPPHLLGQIGWQLWANTPEGES